VVVEEEDQRDDVDNGGGRAYAGGGGWDSEGMVGCGGGEALCGRGEGVVVWEGGADGGGCCGLCIFGECYWDGQGELGGVGDGEGEGGNEGVCGQGDKEVVPRVRGCFMIRQGVRDVCNLMVLGM